MSQNKYPSLKFFLSGICHKKEYQETYLTTKKIKQLRKITGRTVIIKAINEKSALKQSVFYRSMGLTYSYIHDLDRIKQLKIAGDHQHIYC